MDLTNLQLPNPQGNIYIRYWNNQDAECIVEGAQDTYITAITSIPVQCSQNDALEWIQRQNDKINEGTDLPLCIANFKTNKALGMIGIFGLRNSECSGGYWIAPNARDKGISATALQIITPWAFNFLHIESIKLFIEPDNHASIKTAELANYSYSKIEKSNIKINGNYPDMLTYLHKKNQKLKP